MARPRLPGVLLALLACSARPAGSQDSPCELGESQVPEPGLHRFQLAVRGAPRFFVLHVPPGARGGARRALWVLAPGAYNSPGLQIQFADLVPFANEHDLAFAALEGEDNLMNVEKGGQARDDGPSDVEYALQVVRQAAARLCVDRRRVYCVGYSRGARFCSRLASELPGTFAAYGMVSGVRFPRPNNATRPMPIIAFHGDADPINPFAGPGHNDYWFSSVPSAISQWAGFNKCATVERRKAGSNVTLERHGSCSANADVVLFEIAGGGHTWPGSTFEFDECLGETTQEISANSEMLKFFERYELPEGSLEPEDLSVVGSHNWLDWPSGPTAPGPVSVPAVADQRGMATDAQTEAAKMLALAATQGPAPLVPLSEGPAPLVPLSEGPAPLVPVSPAGEQARSGTTRAPAGAASAAAGGPPPAGCLSASSAWEPIDMYLPSREAGAEACQRRCAATAGCAHFSFYEPLRHCHIQDNLALYAPRRPDWVSGPFRCWNGTSHDLLEFAGEPPEEDRDRARNFACLEIGTVLTRANIDATRYSRSLPRRDAVASCQGWCNSTASCVAFSMNFVTHVCSLHASKGGPVHSIMGTVTGPPSCPDRADEARSRHGDDTTTPAVETINADDIVIRAEAVSLEATPALRARRGPLMERLAAILPCTVAVVCSLFFVAAACRSAFRRIRGMRASWPEGEAESVEDLVATVHLIDNGNARE